MATCQNGWPASEDRAAIHVQNFVIPDTQVKVALRADVAPLFLAFAQWWHHEIEPLIPGTCWGYSFRKVRGSQTDLSNHSGGGALDLNAPQHPLGRSGTLGSKTGIVIAKAASMGLRSGAGYNGRKDEMHVEGNVSLARAIELANALQGHPGPVPALPSVPGGRQVLRLLNPYMTDGAPTGPIHDFQRVAGAWYPGLNLEADGVFGPASEAAAKYVQRMNGLEPDGIVGPRTYGALKM